jgi:hypothetical protein
MTSVVPFTVLSAVATLSSELEGWTLLDESNEQLRQHRLAVAFERSFATPPVVQVAIAALDTSNEANLRVRVRAVSVTSRGFVIEVETWFNSKVWAVDVSWLAIGT